MKRLVKVFLLMFVTIFMVSTMLACTTKPKDDDDNGEVHELAGEYSIDIAAFGMPLVFFLRINDDGTFILSPNRNFTDNRGSGLLGESDGTYMMVYEDHTPDIPKTATFVVENHNLVFQTTLPYGASNIMQSIVDPDDPEITHVLTAKTFMFEEYYNVYAGGHTTTGMGGSTIEYNYTLTLGVGLEYVIHSEFEMGGTVYDFTEKGTYTIEDDVITIVPEGADEVVGSILESGAIEIGVKPSAMATSRTVSVLQVATHAQYAGTFYGFKSLQMGMGDPILVDSILVLDIFGGYEVHAMMDGAEEPYVETGTYNVEGTEITFEVDDTEDVLVGTLENHVLTINVKIVEGAMPRTSIVHYGERIQGTFTGSATHEEVEYTVELVLNANGTYVLEITDPEGVVVAADGNFTITRAMTVNINLVGMDPTPGVAVAVTGLNFTILLPGMEPGNGMGSGLGFSLTK